MLSRFGAGVRNVFRKNRVEEDLEKELRAYLDLLTAEKVASGLNEKEARRAARIEMGGVDQVKEAVRDVRAGAFLESLSMDARYSIKSLARNPGFTAVALLSLALGIGANTAIFTLIDNLMLKLLPVRNPEELVIFSDPAWESRAGFQSYPVFKALQERNQVFSGMIASRTTRVYLGTDSLAENAWAEVVSGNYFQVLGVTAAVGRTITPEDDRVPGGHPVAVLSHQYWQQRFAGDPNIAGKLIRVNQLEFTIVGVTPPEFTGIHVGRAVDIRIPTMMVSTAIPNGTFLNNTARLAFAVMGRLKPGVSARQAEAALNPQYLQILQEMVAPLRFSDERQRRRFTDRRIELDPCNMAYSEVRIRFSRPLVVLMGLVGIVLLIACANIAGLLLARATARRKEIAVRLALGASSGRLVRHALMESFMLAAFGGLLGVLCAWLMVDLIAATLPSMIETARLEITPDKRVFGFAAAICFTTAGLFGAVPALYSSRITAGSLLKDEGSAVVGGARFFLRKALVVAQVAFSIVLLSGAGLFLQSFKRLQNDEMGIDRTRIVQVGLDLRRSGYKGESIAAFHGPFVAGLKGLPGVRSVATAAWGMVLREEGWWHNVYLPGREGERLEIDGDFVNSEVFSTFGLRLLSGRTWTAAEDTPVPQVAVINEAFVKRYFSDQQPIGRSFAIEWGNNRRQQVEVIGVVGDHKYEGIRKEPRPFLFLPGRLATIQPYYYVRTEGDPRPVMAAVRRLVQKMEPTMAMGGPKTIEASVNRSLSEDRLLAGLSTALGFVGALMAAIGLYGVIAYSVIRRTREIGLRIALGAQRGNVWGLVLRELLALAGIGILIGVPAALGLARLARGLLFEVSPADPLIVTAATVAMLAVAVLAGYLPAYRASSIDPIAALRNE